MLSIFRHHSPLYLLVKKVFGKLFQSHIIGLQMCERENMVTPGWYGN